MIEQSHLLPECFGDTTFVDVVIKSRANHKRSISQVFVALKGDFKNRKAIGIIDDDKKKDAYYDEFEIKFECEYCRHLVHPNGRHELIVLKKDLEHFLMSCCTLVEVEHKYTKDLETLKRITKSINVGSNGDFKNLINTLIQKKCEPILRIREILQKGPYLDILLGTRTLPQALLHRAIPVTACLILCVL